MEKFGRNDPSTSKGSFQYIPFISPSINSDEIVYDKTVPRGNLNGEEVCQFYNEIISSPASCSQPPMKVQKRPPKRTKKKAVSECVDSRLTVFHHAQNGNIEGIKHLMSKQCDVNATDMYGWTPLMCATFEGHYNVVEYLLKCGADLSMKNKQGFTAFDIAVTKNNRALMDLLKNGTVNEDSCSTTDSEAVQEEIKYCNKCNVSYSESTMIHERSIAHLFSTQDADVSTYYHIPENNKGFQMMLKKGWDKNKGLGVDAKGRKFPIKTVLKTDRTCIGGKKEVPKVTHFGPNDISSVKSSQPTLNLKREHKLKKSEATKLERRNRQFEIEFRREFHL